MENAKLLFQAIAFDHGDARRIQHFIKVYAFASLIGRQENLPREKQDILEAAAILHDIGIHAAEAKFHSVTGHYQELEGPAPAREILTKLGYSTSFVERVCFLVGHHHTYAQVDDLDYQILIEADFLVNAFEDALSLKTIRTFSNKVFRTASGLRLLHTMFGSEEERRFSNY